MLSTRTEGQEYIRKMSGEQKRKIKGSRIYSFKSAVKGLLNKTPQAFLRYFHKRHAYLWMLFWNQYEPSHIKWELETEGWGSDNMGGGKWGSNARDKFLLWRTRWVIGVQAKLSDCRCHYRTWLLKIWFTYRLNLTLGICGVSLLCNYAWDK